MVVDRYRPEYTFERTDARLLPLTFENLAQEPVATLARLVEEYEAWGLEHWSSEALQHRATEESWKPEMLQEAMGAAAEHTAELQRLRAGVAVLERDADLRQAFQLMNRAMRRAARGRYAGWRPFQIGFILSVLPSLVNEGEDWQQVEIVWFATGGGKTETYLGLLVLAAFYDRLRGKLAGITAWSRFPLRMLSLQQTQRFADALAAAELVRRECTIGGEPISLGYFIGAGATPNEVPTAPTDHNPIDVDEPRMADRYQVLTACPFCGSKEIRMKFHRGDWTLRHLCVATGCPSEGKPLPVYVVDQEIYRFLPTVVIGTLDKAALIAMQGGMRGFFEGPAGRCSRPGHGFTYAKRAKRPTGCLVPDCPGDTTPWQLGTVRDSPPPSGCKTNCTCSGTPSVRWTLTTSRCWTPCKRNSPAEPRKSSPRRRLSLDLSARWRSSTTDEGASSPFLGPPLASPFGLVRRIGCCAGSSRCGRAGSHSSGFQTALRPSSSSPYAACSTSPRPYALRQASTSSTCPCS